MSLQWKSFNVWDSITRWSVPVFVMISGVLFLGNERGSQIKNLITKNVKHILQVFLIWSLFYTVFSKLINPAMSWTEVVISFIKGPFHLWYLIMLVGLYMLTPLLNQLVKNEACTKYMLFLALIFTFIIPTLQLWYEVQEPFTTDTKIVQVCDTIFYNYQLMELHLVSGYSAYFVLGYYLGRTDIPKRWEYLSYILSVLGFVGTIVLSDLYAQKTGAPCKVFYDYFSVNVFLESIGVFVLFKQRFNRVSKKHYSLILRLGKYSFGVYLIHLMVLRGLAQIGLDTLSMNPWISVPIIGCIVFVLSYVAAFILYQIPFVKRHIL